MPRRGGRRRPDAEQRARRGAAATSAILGLVTAAAWASGGPTPEERVVCDALQDLVDGRDARTPVAGDRPAPRASELRTCRDLGMAVEIDAEVTGPSSR